MLTIAICDANTEYRKVTADIWSRALFDTEEVSFLFYGGGKGLIDDYEKGTFQADILIMDLLLPDVSGLRLLQYVRNKDAAITIILQTEAEELAVVGYRYRVFDFIVKHKSLKEIGRVINRYEAEKIRTDENILTVQIQGSAQRLRLDRITFFESEAHRIRAFGPDEDIVFYMKMDDLEEMVAERGFVRCHQSYLVNGQWIRGMTSGILTLINRNEIPVSRRYQKAVRNFIDQTIHTAP